LAGDLGGYPPPIIDLAVAARSAKARLTDLRRTAGYREASLEVFRKHGSRKRRMDDDAPARRRSRRAVPLASPAQLFLQFGDEGQG
jgi:deoxyribodipyrimidine photo-lyase